ncbi:MAG: ATP-dependent DNA helicase RecG [Spirochaetota bacterium]
MLLGELKHSVTKLKGVGPRTAAQMAGMGVVSVADLLLHVPRDYEDRSKIVPLEAGYQGATVNTIVEVLAHDFFGSGYKKTLKIFVKDETAGGVLVCFNRNFLQQVLKVGQQFYLYGQFAYRYGELQSTSFEAEPYPSDNSKFGSILPVYPLSGKLNQAVMRKAVQDALNTYGRHIDTELPESLRSHYRYPEKLNALTQLHFPDSHEAAATARQALAYEELLYFQLVVARRATARSRSSRSPQILPQGLQQRCLRQLPFKLTGDQRSVLKEIKQDLDSSKPMGRLLQGDVGAGKTLVAFLSALPVIEAGYQTAFLAPTELLARQHAEKAAALLEPLGVRVAFLSGNVDKNARRPLLEALKSGEIDLLIGTHALFTKEVVFANLRFIIIDEQHKFGVEQRAQLVEKGSAPDLLLMTATPIPRTLTLTFFGDLEVSSIHTMPPGRSPIITHLARQSNADKVYSAVRHELQRGHQAYFVYPLISGSDRSSLKDAEGAAEQLSSQIFPEFEVALIHSKIREDEKLARMHAFSEGKLDILVSTSVVEVGIDVKNATCMVIEHAERFGLAGLHQLRGRVGRSTLQSYAFLVYSEELTEEGKQRLMVMKQSSDGFFIAEEDLKIRGPGEVTGTRQSGFMRLKFADLGGDLELLDKARKDAFRIIKADPGLLQPPHGHLRKVLECCPPFPEDALSGG